MNIRSIWLVDADVDHLLFQQLWVLFSPLTSFDFLPVGLGAALFNANSCTHSTSACLPGARRQKGLLRDHGESGWSGAVVCEWPQAEIDIEV